MFLAGARFLHNGETIVCLAERSGNESAPLEHGGPKFEPCVARPEGSKFRSGVARNRKFRKLPCSKKPISKTDFQFRQFIFWSLAPQSTFGSSGAPKSSIFWRTVWPGDAGFEFLRARFAPAPEGSKFPSGVASNRKITKVPCP